MCGRSERGATCAAESIPVTIGASRPTFDRSRLAAHRFVALDGRTGGYPGADRPPSGPLARRHLARTAQPSALKAPGRSYPDNLSPGRAGGVATWVGASTWPFGVFWPWTPVSHPESA